MLSDPRSDPQPANDLWNGVLVGQRPSKASTAIVLDTYYFNVMPQEQRCDVERHTVTCHLRALNLNRGTYRAETHSCNRRLSGRATLLTLVKSPIGPRRRDWGRRGPSFWLQVRLPLVVLPHWLYHVPRCSSGLRHNSESSEP